MVDRYGDFSHLRDNETEGIDYRIIVAETESFAGIIAPHGGRIEPGTSEIAAAIAGSVHSLYCFEGLRKRPHGDLHIKSARFDEPECLGLIKRCKFVVAVHGLEGDGSGHRKSLSCPLLRKGTSMRALSDEYFPTFIRAPSGNNGVQDQLFVF